MRRVNCEKFAYHSRKIFGWLFLSFKIDFNNVLDGWYRSLPGYPTTSCQVNGNTASSAEIVITSKPDVHPCFRRTVIGWGIIGATIMLSFLICCLTYYVSFYCYFNSFFLSKLFLLSKEGNWYIILFQKVSLKNPSVLCITWK